MNSKNKKRTISGSFAMQATILAAASVISKVIGMVYNIPFANILGKAGNGYYGAAQTVYGYVWTIAVFSIPAALSKLISERVQRGEYRNVKQIYKGAMLYMLVVGGIASLFTYIVAPYIVTDNTVLSLRILAPTIFISGFASVYRGYFQAYGNMVPTSISQIIEQVINAIVSIVAALTFIKWAVMNGHSELSDVYGAAGGTLGTGVAATVSLIYIVWLFRRQRGTIEDKIAQDTTTEILSYRSVIKLLLMVATPIILSSAIYNVNVILDMTIYQKMLQYMGTGSELIDGQYGLYSRMYLVLANVPIAMAAAVGSAVIPSVSGAYAVGDKEGCNRKIQQSLQLAMVLTIPCAVGFAVLGKPIVRLVYYSLSATDTTMVSNLLLIGGISIVLYGISSVLNGVLQGIGKVNIPVISSITALVGHILLLVPLIAIAKLEIYSLILATAFYAIIVVVMNLYFVKKELRFKMEWKQTVGVPVLSATVMGTVAFLVYKVLNWGLLHIMGAFISNAIAVLIAIGLAAITYFVVMLKAGGYTEEMLLAFPKGTLLVKLARRLHFIQ
ncbi:MAG: polysaccharide biosynthesis protein [Clostridium sp.]|nr:polysaccharide biosynthesis protein [Clostridium sp.]